MLAYAPQPAQACVDYVRSFNVPMLVLGGGGYTIRNVSSGCVTLSCVQRFVCVIACCKEV